MKYWSEFQYYFGEIEGKRKKIDNTIYAFDIESTNYIKLNNKILQANEYLKLTDDEKNMCEFKCFMYIWTFSINKDVYYGRTWEEFKKFLIRLEKYNKAKKIIFIHNLAFEFQFLKSVFNFKNVMARKIHKVMKCELEDFNIEFRCTYFMSNCSLAFLPKVFCLPVEKKVGDLDYNLIRTPITKMNEKELSYCEYDVLVIYYYILSELKSYERVDKIPITSTGHVRKELKETIKKDYEYKNAVKKSINIDPHIYNLLIEAFAGRIYTCKLDLYRRNY